MRLISGAEKVAPESKPPQQSYRPAYLDHFEKLEENQNKLNKGNGIRPDANTPFPKNFLGPMDFEFVSNI